MPGQPKNLYYDREHSLRELLKEIDLPRLEVVLQGLLGEGARLLDSDGTVRVGPAQTPAGAQRASFRLDFEPFGYLEGTRAEGLPAAVMFMEMLLVAVMRYYMVSAIHMEAVQEDFAALQVSEARYKTLAESLEKQVQEQVQTIEQAQRQLYQADKLASVGQLAAGVAHEINNPLGFVRSNLNSAAGYVAQFGKLGALIRSGQSNTVLVAAWRNEQMDQVLEDFPVLLQESVDGVERVAKIVSALRDFSSIDQAEETAADINALIQNTCQMAASEFGNRVHLTTDYRRLPALRCHAGRLSQVFMNLLLNAVQAIPESGEVRVATSSDGDAVTVQIADTGKGIPEAQLARIFDPFFTTREVGQGTGLGLTVARDIVQAHSGRIEVESRVGAGTTFTITLPVTPHD